MSLIESQQIQSLLNIHFISRIRRNHALEHAVLHILSKKYPGKRAAGRSDSGGFWILGDFSKEDVYESVEEAIERISAGEKNLAIHPNCGTNFVTSGTIAGLAGVAGMAGVGNKLRDKLERLPLVALLSTLALIASQPLGLIIQERITTSANIAGMEIGEVVKSQRGRIKTHRVLTRG